MVCTWCGYVCVNLRVEEEGGRWGLAKKIPRACGLASLAKGWLMGREIEGVPGSVRDNVLRE